MKTINIIEDGNGCISIDALEQYVNGTLSESQKNSIDAHIAKCQDCADMLDGLKIAKEADINIDNVVYNINNKVDKIVMEKESNNSKSNSSVYYLISAIAVAASIVAVYFAFNIINNNVDNFSPNDIAVNANSINTELENNEAIENLDADEIDNSDFISQETEVQSKPMMKKSIGFNKPEKKIETSEIVTRGEGVAITKSKSVSNSNAKIPPEQLEKIINLISQGEYFDAKNILEDILNEDPENSEAYKYLGICNLNLEYYKQALNNFDAVNPSSDEEKYEVMYYQAMCYVSLNNNQKAKSILEIVRDNSNNFANLASTMLESL
ncbi:MAG: zf-HC2 domain-containing protein [Bacteroidales bacterium]|nr:zf-HC2 domain-containing protein [Bacteroidales bacterium]